VETGCGNDNSGTDNDNNSQFSSHQKDSKTETNRCPARENDEVRKII